MTSIYKYGDGEAEEENASGVSGVLCSGAAGSYFFRVYHSDTSFTDYDLRHDDLSVTISPDALASFYKVQGHNVLDHSPEVLGLEQK
ncbi:hypothetical protein SAMN04488490_3220 [Marinobacter sp. LV10R510-11A]|jgi:hypothetical protein|uniref:hypothetical protein n=1 Tax=Marinobacter sp. LV10R510-11A TaxID=1415568 RepID=UPI000BB957E2|nr:hypothetical protein [Marinobacter sp. LV10R510-11A]SOB77411.1 hypothetical protein SAMN04488490_3220 [Marinobacter sp. LV10R510-11A]